MYMHISWLFCFGFASSTKKESYKCERNGVVNACLPTFPFELLVHLTQQFQLKGKIVISRTIFIEFCYIKNEK